MLALCGTVAPMLRKVDTCLNDYMRTISGALKSTPRTWLPVMSGIAPPHIRRAAAEQKKYRQILELTPQNCTRRIVESAPHTSRPSSRNPFYKVLTQILTWSTPGGRVGAGRPFGWGICAGPM